ncbi:MAG: cyclic-phosphate processing receiver domain-containing protein [Acidobacteriota bacterium]
MKIFLLDDSIRRLQRFHRVFCTHEIAHSADAQEAIIRLAEERFDLICLDHDLTEHDTNWIASGTGFEVAEFLGSNDTPNNETLIIVHTMNPAGGERMMLALKHRYSCRISIIDLFNPEVIANMIEAKQKKN